MGRADEVGLRAGRKDGEMVDRLRAWGRTPRRRMVERSDIWMSVLLVRRCSVTDFDYRSSEKRAISKVVILYRYDTVGGQESRQQDKDGI